MKKQFISTVTKLLLAGFLAGSLTSCAAIFKGDSRTVALNSEPMGAQVYINGVNRGSTPVRLDLVSKKNYTVEFRKDGYENQVVALDNKLGVGWIVLDVLGGLVPVIIDAATGSWYGFAQKDVNAALTPSDMSVGTTVVQS